jgi:hypothetical protein
MALTDIVYKRKKDDQVVALVIASPVLKEWQLDQVIHHDMVYYKLSSVETLSPNLKYPYRYTLVPIQHHENIDLVKSNAITYIPETIAEFSDKAKAFRMEFTAPFFGLIVSMMPGIWQKRYGNINPYYHASLSTGLSGIIEMVIGLAMSISGFMSGATPIMNLISSWLVVEGMLRARIGFKADKALGSIPGVIVALPLELILLIIRGLKKLRA